MNLDALVHCRNGFHFQLSRCEIQLHGKGLIRGRRWHLIIVGTLPPPGTLLITNLPCTLHPTCAHDACFWKVGCAVSISFIVDAGI